MHTFTTIAGVGDEDDEESLDLASGVAPAPAPDPADDELTTGVVAKHGKSVMNDSVGEIGGAVQTKPKRRVNF